jgi:Chorismate synthase
MTQLRVDGETSRQDQISSGCTKEPSLRVSRRDEAFAGAFSYPASCGSFSRILNHHTGASRHSSWPGGGDGSIEPSVFRDSAFEFSLILRSMLTYRTAGESHGQALIALVEGLPANLPVDFEFIDNELKRRQGGYGRGGRMKIEKDRVRFLSGVRHGKTLGSPVAMMVENRDWPNWEEIMSALEISSEAAQKRTITRPRPGHTDLAGSLKFNQSDARNILERHGSLQARWRRFFSEGSASKSSAIPPRSAR